MEQLIDIKEKIVESNNYIISLVKKDNYYIIEKCILEEDKINLLESIKTDSFKEAKKFFNLYC